MTPLKELVELRRRLEKTLSQNMDLVIENKDLRRRITHLKAEIQELMGR